jgi:hypothetical protein
VHIQFPWGSLLQTVATGDPQKLNKLLRICSKNALLKIIICLDPVRDGTEIERLKLAPLTSEYISHTLIPRYAEAGFEVFETGCLLGNEYSDLKSSWAKRLRRFNVEPIYLIGRPFLP